MPGGGMIAGAHRDHAQRVAGGRIAGLFQEELTKAIPGWRFPVRKAPLGVLASATMPAIVLEIGNVNNSTNSQTLMDNAFQSRIASAIVTAIQRFSELQTPAAN